MFSSIAAILVQRSNTKLDLFLLFYGNLNKTRKSEDLFYKFLTAFFS